MNPYEKETTSEEDKFGAIHLLQTSYLVRYWKLNKELQNGAYVLRDTYLTTSGGYYGLIFFRSFRYQSIGNGSNRGGMRNSNGRGNQQNQRRVFMFLKQDINGVDLNGFPPEYQLVRRKYGSTCSLE